MKKLYPVLFLFFFLVSGTLKSQISQGGTPVSFHSNSLKKDIDIRNIPAPDMETIMMEDMENDGFGKAYRIGIIIPVNLNPQNSGTWETLSNGDLLWRLQINMPGAEASNLLFDRFVLPPGAKLFVYTPDQTFTIGAFTEFNNHESGLMATQMIPGGSSVVELYMPKNQEFSYELEITEVGYNYRSTGFKVQEKDLSCMVNVKCPEGNNWADQIRGAAKAQIRIGSYWFLCSGSLVTTTTNSCQPYFLLADHCTYDNAYATAANMNQWVFNFNYQASNCTGTTGPTTQSMTGCTMKAHDTYGQNSQGSDFYLVLMNNSVPTTYQVYYNGWSKSTTAATSGVGIHHPEGVIKKISTYSTSLQNYTTHWRVVWAQTTTNRSVTAQGSSGSPIFDQNKLIVGTLTGGGSFCDAPADPDYYGKFSYHWASNGTTNAKQLKPWLDPNNSNPTTKTGVNYNACSSSSVEEIVAPNLNLNVFPNPATDVVNVSFENYYFENGTVRIYDILGNMVSQVVVSQYQNEIPLSVKHLSNGVYFIQCSNSEHSFSKSFMISK